MLAFFSLSFIIVRLTVGKGGSVCDDATADEDWSKHRLCCDIARVVRAGLGESLPEKIVIVGHR